MSKKTKGPKKAAVRSEAEILALPKKYKDDCKVTLIPTPAPKAEKIRKRYGTRTAARPFIDYDYWDRLSSELQSVVRKFYGEYYLDKFNSQDDFHNTPDLQRERYNAGYSRRTHVIVEDWVSSEPNGKVHNKQAGRKSDQNKLMDPFVRPGFEDAVIKKIDMGDQFGVKVKKAFDKARSRTPKGDQ